MGCGENDGLLHQQRTRQRASVVGVDTQTTNSFGQEKLPVVGIRNLRKEWARKRIYIYIDRYIYPLAYMCSVEAKIVLRSSPITIIVKEETYERFGVPCAHVTADANQQAWLHNDSGARV